MPTEPPSSQMPPPTLTEEVRQNDKKEMAKGFVVLTVLNNLTTVGDVLVVLYASVFFSLQDMGLYNLLYQYIPIFTLIINFGFINTATKYITYYDSQKSPSKSAGVVYMIGLMNCLFAIVSAAVFMSLAGTFSRLLTGTADYRSYIMLMGIEVITIPNQVFNHFFTARYRFKVYLVGNLVGNLLRIGTTFYLFGLLQDISAFFYANIIGYGFQFVYFVIQTALEYQKPEFAVGFREIFKFAGPLFFGKILVYIKQYLSNLIFFYFVPDLAQMGLLFFIRVLYGILIVSFDSMHNILTVYYSSILYTEGAKPAYREATFQISRFFTLLAIVTGFAFMLIGPFFTVFITVLFHYEGLYAIGTGTILLFGVYFFLHFYYYIPPTVIIIHKDSNKLLEIHFVSSIAYVVSYLVFIPAFGMYGIPISQIIGYLAFNYWCWRDIVKKNGFEVGFDRRTFKKACLASIPMFACVPVLYWACGTYRGVMELDLGFIQVLLPHLALLFTIVVGGLAFGAFLILIRFTGVFHPTEEKLFQQIAGKKLGHLIAMILIAKPKNERENKPVDQGKIN